MIDIESINNNAEFRSELERKLNNVIIPTEELKNIINNINETMQKDKKSTVYP